MKSSDTRLTAVHIFIVVIFCGVLTVCSGESSSVSPTAAPETTDSTFSTEPMTEEPPTTPKPTTTKPPLEPPDGIEFISSTTESIYVNWTGGFGHDGFRIKWENVTVGGKDGNEEVESDERSCNISDLIPGVFYNISVAAYNSDENSPAVSLINGTYPLAPDTAEVLTNTHNSISFKWTHLDGSIYNDVEISCEPSQFCDVGVTDVNEAIAENLTGNMEYNFEIVAISSMDTPSGLLSKKSDAIGLSNWTLSAPVSDLSAKSMNSSSLEVSWNYPQDNGVSEAGIYCYRLHVYDESEGNRLCVQEVLFTRNESCASLGVCGTSENEDFNESVTRVVGDLEPCGNYSVEVDVINTAGHSEIKKKKVPTATLR